MGTVHAKVQENLTEAHYPTNTARELPDKEQMKELDLKGVRARVDKVHIDGLSRTKNDIIQDSIQDLFKARDFWEVLLKAYTVRVKLDELGCFKNIAVYIDTSKGPKATPDGLEVTFNVKEHKRILGGVSTHVGNNEGVLQIGVRAPNIFGRGEKVQVEYSHGSKKTSNFNVAFIKPFRGKHRTMLNTSIFQSNTEYPPSAYKLMEKGLTLGLGFYSWPLLKHTLQWEGTIRDLSVLSRNASFDVRKESGLSLKSSLKHILALDLRDETIFPTTGSLVQLTSEYAGVGGDVGFLKNDVFVQTNYSILPDIVLQGSLTMGYMKSINKDLKISLADMYFLGGPLSVRGFQMRGIGPHSDGDALGSNVYWAGGLHLFTPLPFRPGKGGFGDLFRTHFFVNTGNVGNIEVKSGQSILELMRNNVRLSYGLGIALRLGNMARLEINYCFPYVHDKSDQTHPGVQFGVGVQFL
ncbi:unnamed protein product [Phyllotreta striolata]|uniref:Bacterial surface antigen (D15) domain-containing protein n=1 Tax=Phyllotreta striolata TaxID=444603 RepID=A0A9N9XS74_PHYSR|nr:unnamed protein product [Phyllotreta striolata]